VFQRDDGEWYGVDGRHRVMASIEAVTKHGAAEEKYNYEALVLFNNLSKEILVRQPPAGETFLPII